MHFRLKLFYMVTCQESSHVQDTSSERTQYLRKPAKGRKTWSFCTSLQGLALPRPPRSDGEGNGECAAAAAKASEWRGSPLFPSRAVRRPVLVGHLAPSPSPKSLEGGLMGDIGGPPAGGDWGVVGGMGMHALLPQHLVARKGRELVGEGVHSFAVWLRCREKSRSTGDLYAHARVKGGMGIPAPLDGPGARDGSAGSRETEGHEEEVFFDAHDASFDFGDDGAADSGEESSEEDEDADEGHGGGRDEEEERAGILARELSSMRTHTNVFLGSLQLLSAKEIGAVAAALTGNTTVTNLSLSGVALGSGASTLCEALKGNTTLRQLDLTRTSLSGEEGFTALANMLRSNSTLESLVLSNNDPGALSGWAALSSALAVNSTLRFLDLSKCLVGEEGYACTANALRSNKGLRWLSLGFAYTSVAFPGLLPLAEALRDTPLPRGFRLQQPALRAVSRELGLPQEARDWPNEVILAYFGDRHLHKAQVFGQGRLDQRSPVSCLTSDAVGMIIDAFLRS